MKKEPEFIIIKDTREQIPWEFNFEHTVAEEIGTIKTGDYTIKGLEDKICIERKGCIEEFANNLGRDYIRFKKEMIRMDEFEHAFIICEFPLRDLIDYPFHGHNTKLQQTTRISGSYLLKVIFELQLEHKVKIMFCGNKFYAMKTALSLMKRVNERYNRKKT